MRCETPGREQGRGQSSSGQLDLLERALGGLPLAGDGLGVRAGRALLGEAGEGIARLERRPGSTRSIILCRVASALFAIFASFLLNYST
jgi:hypothetical protein